MAILKTEWSARRKTSAVANESAAIVSQTFVYDLVAASAPALNDIIEMGALPGYCKVVDMVLDCDDLDSNGTPTLSLDVGIMSGDFADDDAGRTVGAEFFDGSTLGQAGGIARMSAQTGFNVAAVADVDRGIGVKIAAAADTAATGQIRLHVQYASVAV